MLDDARSLTDGQVLETDLCIVGAGAAGITLARELADSGLSIVLLEGGGMEYEQSSQELYRGPEQGTILDQNSFYLTSSRLRYFGGTSNHWNGFCRPLDAEDLTPRDWLPGAAWPLRLEELTPFYRRAATVLEVHPFDYDPATAGRWPKLLQEDDSFETTYMHLSPPTRFGSRYRADVEQAGRILALTHANVTRLAVGVEGNHLQHVEAAVLDGPRFRVRPRACVLAAGGIANARLLLASRDVLEQGLGNDHDLVGRYFMDHPTVQIGWMAVPYWRKLMSIYEAAPVHEWGHEVRGMLRPIASFQRQHQIWNALISLQPMAGGKWPAMTAEVSELATDLVRLEGDYPEPELGSTYVGTVTVHTEQRPNRSSRVRLADQPDPLGVPRPRLDWNLTAEDAESLGLTVELLARRLGHRLRGRMRVDLLAEQPWRGTVWSNHHLGTTRMAAAPEAGVVDPDCRVHGIDNLFLAGSSVFPSSGCSNPTYTIVALTLRLADHLLETFAA